LWREKYFTSIGRKDWPSGQNSREGTKVANSKPQKTGRRFSIPRKAEKEHRMALNKLKER